MVIATGKACRVQRPDDRGANLVEMALIMPFLLLLVVGVIDVGRAFYTYISLTNAAREGVRFASQYPFVSNGPDIANLVTSRALGEPSTESDPWGPIIVTIDTLVPEGQPVLRGQPITVTVEQDYSVILGGILRFNGTPVFPPLTIRSYATMIVFGVNDVSGS